MQSTWENLISYFGDGYTVGCSPLRFDLHYCHLKSPPQKRSNTLYGVDLGEDAMRFFSVLGATEAPPCACEKLKDFHKHLSSCIKRVPDYSVQDYSITTAKGDKTSEEACRYAMRDAIQWWAHWHGSLDGHFWKHLYIAFSTIPDDLMIPPQDLTNNSFRFLGHSLSDLLDGLYSEGVHADDVKLLGKFLERQYILQYLEKADPKFRNHLLSNTTVMTQIRTLTANTHGAAIALLAARGTKSQGRADKAVEAAAICDALSMDMAKEALGVLDGEATETVAGDRSQLKRELRWVYIKCLQSLDASPSCPLLRRFATAGFHYVPMMERYRERANGHRISMSADLEDYIDMYVNRTNSLG